MTEPIPWQSLDEETQTQLRIEHQVWLDGQPPTCSLDTKLERFRIWLGERGILFSASDLKRP